MEYETENEAETAIKVAATHARDEFAPGAVESEPLLQFQRAAGLH
jgi:hypothetical protein